MNKAFLTWLLEAQKQLDVIAPLLNEPLSDEPSTLENQLKDLEAYGYRILTLAADAEVYLRQAQCEVLKVMPSSAGVLEKETFMEADTAQENRIYRILKGLVGDRNQAGLLQRRISLGQTFLANQRELLKKAQG